MKKDTAFAVFAALFLTIASIRLGSAIWGSPSLGRLAFLGIAGWAIALLVVIAARTLTNTVWVSVAIASLALLLMPDSAISAITIYLPSSLEEPTTFAFLVAVPGAIVVAALLANSALQAPPMGPGANPDLEKRPLARSDRLPRSSIPAVSLSLLVLAAALGASYRFLIWDSTNDPLGTLWLGVPILSALFSGALLVSVLPGRRKSIAVLFLMFVPLLIATAKRAISVDFRQLTEANGAQTRRAIEAFYVQEGRYPSQLGELVPRYALYLAGPKIIYGQTWCYQGGEDYYRLGYLDRDHWSSPILFGRVLAAKGHPPLQVDVCQAAIDAYRAQHPDWDRVLLDYGRPTPTPDVGE